jgi:hypothetical protein
MHFHRESRNISCSCNKFEMCGILCCHALVVLRDERVDDVDERYVLKR